MSKTSHSTKKQKTVTDTNIDLGLLNKSLGYTIRRAQLKIFKEFNHFFEALDIKPAQFSVIEIIHNNPGLRQSEVARVLSIQRTNMVGMLDQLQDRDLIERKPSTEDLRAHALYLTKKGNKLLQHLHQQFAIHEGSLIKRLGKDNLEAVKSGLETIINTHDLSDD